MRSAARRQNTPLGSYLMSTMPSESKGGCLAGMGSGKAGNTGSQIRTCQLRLQRPCNWIGARINLGDREHDKRVLVRVRFTPALCRYCAKYQAQMDVGR